MSAPDTGSPTSKMAKCWILLLCGGDNATQQKDIDKAHRLANEWRVDIKERDDEQHE